MESELSNRDNLILKENCDAGIAIPMYLLS